MILGQVSYLDIIVFLAFLAPQLLIHVGIFATLACALRALPFLGRLSPHFQRPVCTITKFATVPF